MRTKYFDLIDQTFDFPQNEFHLREDRLFFHGIDLMRLIQDYGTPLKFNYLPQISNNIQRAKGWFREAISNLGYAGNYYYSYCTKSNHFSFVLDEVLKNDVHIETSSAFDIDIVRNLYNSGKLAPGKFVICNGYKPKQYIENICGLINEGNLNVIPVVDNTQELYDILAKTDKEIKIGVRIASEEEPKFEFYTSRLGIRYREIVPFYKAMLKDNPQRVCNDNEIPEPNIFTEFGSFTVGESGGAIFSVLHQKQQNDREKWNMIDSSFMTNLPDTWAINQRFIMLPVNRWNDDYERVLLGGLTCDSDDYYNSEQHSNAIYLPKFDRNKPLYLGFFNTGAYQETIGGFGGLKHCLIPEPKHILIQRDQDGKLYTQLFSEEQTAADYLRILGY